VNRPGAPKDAQRENCEFVSPVHVVDHDQDRRPRGSLLERRGKPVNQPQLAVVERGEVVERRLGQ
jgi:hypothetical protein